MMNKIITEEEIKFFGFTEDEIQNLIISHILKEENGVYLLEDEQVLMYYSRQLKYFGKRQFSYKCLKLAHLYNPQDSKISFELFYSSITNQDFEAAVLSLRFLIEDDNVSDYEFIDYKIYLYLLSFIIPLPIDLREKANSIEKSDIQDLDSDNKDDKDDFNINLLIYSQKWGLARKLLHKDLQTKNKPSSNSLKYLLLSYAHKAQLNSKMTIDDLLDAKDYTGALGYLENLSKIHQLSLIEKYTCKILKDLIRMVYFNLPPIIINKPAIKNSNIYDLINASKYDEALNLADTYSRMNNNILYRALKAIVNIQNTISDINHETTYSDENTNSKIAELLNKGLTVNTICQILNIPTKQKYYILLKAAEYLYQTGHNEQADEIYNRVNNLGYKEPELVEQLYRVNEIRKNNTL